MEKNFLYLAYSGWWIALILIISVFLSYLLYSKKDVPWNKIQNRLLGILRFLAVALLLFLFLSPSIRNVSNSIEKPVFALAIDNSQSMVGGGTSEEQAKEMLDEMEKALVKQDIEVERIRLQDTSAFSATTTNLSNLIAKSEDQLQDQNFTGLVLVTDGIFNRGSSPLYTNYLYPVYTLGLGDTIPQKDISISRALFNRVTYKGNETPIRLEISQNGFTNKEVSVQLVENGEVFIEQKLRLKKSIQEVAFTIKSESKGLRRIVAKVSTLPEESTFANNVSNIFMDVIDGRKRILIVGNSPHPDIRAIRTTLEETGNYETHVYIPEINDEKPSEIYDVAIFHGAFTSGINFEPKINAGSWFILSNESSITSINKNLSFISIERRGSNPDKVAGSFNQSFSKFKIEDFSAFEEYPPVEVPFGEYKISGPTEVFVF
ncbi:MAG: hypothetical protein AAFY41_06515 [Bacteroidota bacterium]